MNPRIDAAEEISRHDWAGIACGCGASAEHVPEALLRIVSGRAPDAGELEGHVKVQSFLYEPAVPTAAVLMAALAEDLRPPARTVVLDLLLSCCSADSPEIAARCEAHLRAGIDALYRELLHGPSERCRGSAYEILS